MPELLLELGTEELPAHAVRRAYGELANKIASALIDHGILASGVEPASMGTPRRLIVSISGIESRQPDGSKEQRGPGIKAAYDEDGKPTQALLGFCRSQGIEPSDLRQDGQYVWVTKKISGRPTAEILSEEIPKLIRSLTFDKTMRWGASKMRFARPIRWILATLDGKVIPFELEGVTASNRSFGHRFYSPEAFTASTLTQLLKGLRTRHVEPDPDRRRKMIVDKLPKIKGGSAELPEALVEENVFLTEWPTPILGEFASSFLELPSPVLSTVMAKHEKMFPVLNEKGEVKNQFVFVRNSGEDASVRKGCEWVLNARMNDAKFFFDEDRRLSVDEFLTKTKGIVFQEKLGTVFARSERLRRLAPVVAPAPSDSEDEASYAAEAGKFAKVDLASGLVSELASLQGIVGGTYAAREGQASEVCWAISTQYDPGKNLYPQTAAARTAIRLLMADQLDKLAGYLGIGLEPSGSSDPYGLRRGVTTLIEAAWNWRATLTPYSKLFLESAGLYGEQGVQLDPVAGLAAFGRLFAARYPALMPLVRHDVLEASLITGDLDSLTSPQKVRFRVELMSALAEDSEFVQTATRPINIVFAARKKDIEVNEDLASLDLIALDSDTGHDLWTKCRSLGLNLIDAVEARDLDQSLSLIKQLGPPINAFFEATMVMVEDTHIRDARLTLLAGLSKLLMTAGDFTKIVFEGVRS